MCSATYGGEFFFQPYKTTYFLFDDQDKFQISFQSKILSFSNSIEGLYFGYTQLSYWKQGEIGNANPFIYSNYNPELFYRFRIPESHSPLKGLQLGYEHQSDGLGLQFDPIHREWDLVFIVAEFSLLKDGKLDLQAKIWHPENFSDYNPDIVKYLGYSQFTFRTNKLKAFWQPQLEVTFLKGTAGSLKDLSWCVEDNVRISPEKLPFKTPLAFFIHWYNGYGESLRYYNQKTNRVRYGISLSW
ncbi:MAG: phospholipase A [Candidatus Riflebacteria bacterium]|nr:phospholipase A [Candidatus Riflebacteria bacterium]